MKKLSIRFRVTLWFTLLMTLLVGVVLTFLFLTSGSILHVSSEKKLVYAVASIEEPPDANSRSDEHSNGKGENGFIRKGVYLSVYDASGTLLEGIVPTGFDSSTPFLLQQARTIETNGVKWTVYDTKIVLPQMGEVWVRGVQPAGDSEATVASMMQIALIALPFFVVLAALGGYFLTGRAFRPVKQIRELAEEIGDGKDLSKRIRLGEGKDEIYTLANTFDRMFDRLEQSFEREKQFTSDASHELRTPTSVIISQCEYALENAETVEETKSALTVILRHAQKMSALISQLLALTRGDKGQQKLTLELVNFSELAELVAEELRERAEEKSITIQTKLEPNLLIRGDETMLMRMLINLVSNGITYGHAGGTVYIELHRDGGNIIGHIRDDGIGIAAENLNKIWERFYQVDPSRTSSLDGVGLGLSMVKMIVAAHNGTISVQSELGQGSDFAFILPF